MSDKHIESSLVSSRQTYNRVQLQHTRLQRGCASNPSEPDFSSTKMIIILLLKDVVDIDLADR